MHLIKVFRQQFPFRFIFCLLVVVFFFSETKPAKATHLVGGEISYECLDSNLHLYKFTLRIYRDCGLGTAEFDSAFYFAIRRHSDNGILPTPYGLKLTLIKRDTLDNATYSVCKFSPSSVCVELGLYTGTCFIPTASTGGYYVLFEKCCRNASILNLSPCCGSSNVIGAGWYLDIPDYAITTKNSSAVFNRYPPTVLCNNADFIFDHSAHDVDGDSLVYSICNAWNGAGISNSTPVPSGSLPLTSVTYQPPNTALQPLGPASTLNINSQTGLLTGHAMALGRYVITICVEEYRHGVLLCTNRRDFQFNIQNCDTTSTAVFNYDVHCNNRVSFTNQSINVSYDSTYHWDFGVAAANYDTSNLSDPVFTFPGAGNYTVTLTINVGKSCQSQATLNVNVPAKAKANFGFPNVCEHKPVQFTDSSTTNTFNGAISTWSWNFGDNLPNNGSISTLQNPVHTFLGLGPYTVRLIITTVAGCKDTITKQVTMYPVPVVDAGPDVSVRVGGSITLQASGASQYTWSPPTYLSASNIANPVCTPAETIIYAVDGTNQYNCRNSDTVMVEVKLPIDIQVPTAFSPNNDKLNDIFFVYNLAGYSESTIKDFNLKVYNRWGEVIFESISINNGWDGNNEKNGLPMEIGVYAWVVTVHTVDGKTIGPLYGNVSLLR